MPIPSILHPENYFMKLPFKFEGHLAPKFEYLRALESRLVKVWVKSFYHQVGILTYISLAAPKS